LNTTRELEEQIKALKAENQDLITEQREVPRLLKELSTAKAENATLRSELHPLKDKFCEAVKLLGELSDDMMEWHAECDAECVGEMRARSNQIDEFLKSPILTQQALSHWEAK
jgi:predicted  nucleic acid-binding Zn-ribbon protein